MKAPWPSIKNPDGTLNVDAIQENLDALFGGAGGFGGKSIEVRGGKGTLTFAAAANSGTITVPHGLGRVPVSVVCTSYTAPAFGNIPNINTVNWDATSFQVNADVKTAFTGTSQFSWFAIG